MVSLAITGLVLLVTCWFLVHPERLPRVTPLLALVVGIAVEILTIVVVITNPPLEPSKDIIYVLTGITPRAVLAFGYVFGAVCGLLVMIFGVLMSGSPRRSKT